MSADAEIFGTRAVSLAELRDRLPKTNDWDDVGAALAYYGHGWLILVGEPGVVQPDDVPDDLIALEHARYLYPVTLEPIGADETGYAFLADVVESVGAAVDGVGYDPRTGAPRRFGSKEAA